MKFLIVKTSALGDIIQCFHALDYLKERFPFAQIDWVAEKEAVPLLQAHPAIHRIITIDTKKWRRCWIAPRVIFEMLAELRYLRRERYHCVFDLQGSLKSAFTTLFSKAICRAGWKRESLREPIASFPLNHQFEKSQNLSSRQQYLQLIADVFRDKEPIARAPSPLFVLPYCLPQTFKPYKFMVSVGAKWSNKRISSKALIKGLEILAPTHALYFVWGTKKEKEHCEQMLRSYPGEAFILPKLSLTELYAAMKEVDRVIAMDSMPLHLAAYAGVKTLSFFGPTSKEVYAPIGEGHTVYQAPCPYGQTFKERCPKLRKCKSGACLKEISAELIESQLQNRRDLEMILN